MKAVLGKDFSTKQLNTWNLFLEVKVPTKSNTSAVLIIYKKWFSIIKYISLNGEYFYVIFK